MARSEQVKTLVDYLVNNVPEDGSPIELTLNTFSELTKTTSTQAFLVFRYSVIASMDLPDNIVMELRNTNDGKEKSRVRKPYVYKRVQNFDKYKVTENNFRCLSEKDIQNITEVFADRSELSKKTVMIIMYMLDLLALKNTKKVWIRLRDAYLSTVFLIPNDVIRQYINVLIEKGIIMVQKHPYDNKPVLKLNLVCTYNPLLADEVGECMAIGYSPYKKNDINLKLNTNISQKVFDKGQENTIIRNTNAANLCPKEDITQYVKHIIPVSINDAIDMLRKSIETELDAAKTENKQLREKANDYDISSKAFQALNDQYQELVKENGKYKTEYISPTKMKTIKKVLGERIATILNKYSSDMANRFNSAQNGADIFALKREVMTITVDALTSIDKYIDSAEKFAEINSKKSEESFDKHVILSNKDNDIT